MSVRPRSRGFGRSWACHWNSKARRFTTACSSTKAPRRSCPASPRTKPVAVSSTSEDVRPKWIHSPPSPTDAASRSTNAATSWFVTRSTLLPRDRIDLRCLARCGRGGCRSHSLRPPRPRRRGSRPPSTRPACAPRTTARPSRALSTARSCGPGPPVLGRPSNRGWARERTDRPGDAVSNGDVAGARLHLRQLLVRSREGGNPGVRHCDHVTMPMSERTCFPRNWMRLAAA